MVNLPPEIAMSQNFEEAGRYYDADEFSRRLNSELDSDEDA